MVDFHSHILPKMDDGSKSAEESIAMLRRSAEHGVKEVLLTPHFYPQHTTPERFLNRRQRAEELLLRHMETQTGLPRIRTGAEVHYFPQMHHCDVLEELAIQGTRYILVEMPMTEWTDKMYRELEGISRNLGLTPIVAHVDRYLGLFRDYGIPEALSQLPVLVQANASFFLGPVTGGKAMNMLRRGQIHVLGSDCHNLTDRAPNLGNAFDKIRRKLGDEGIKWITQNEHRILRGNR